MFEWKYAESEVKSEWVKLVQLFIQQEVNKLKHNVAWLGSHMKLYLRG